MDVNEFNSTVVRNEDPEAIELDMQPFGARQAEAVEFWLDAALTQGDPFGKRVMVKTDASVILSQSAPVRASQSCNSGAFQSLW